jgi:uncharacterized protein YggE
MRLVVLGLSLALAGSAPLALAVAQPVSTQPLAPGEVLLEINALGAVSGRADSATLAVSITGAGDTEAAARVATEAKIREVRAALRTLGVADADIRIRPVTTSPSPPMSQGPTGYEANAMTYDMNVVAEDVNMVMPIDEVLPPAASGEASAEITVRNVDRAPAVQRALLDQGVYSAAAGITYELADPGAARREARAQAMRKARADAEAYAASLNMRVVRIVRVSERIGLDMMALMATEPQTVMRMFGRTGMVGPDIQTMVVTGVDFVLAPR